MSDTLTQHVQQGFISENGDVVTERRDSYPVSEANRKRIIERERGRGRTEEGWLVFPSHPGTPSLSEYFIRIKWEVAQ